MTQFIEQRLAFPATHQHAADAARPHGHNFDLIARLSGDLQPSGVIIPASTVLGRLAELQPASVSNDSVDALWSGLQTGWPSGVAVRAVALTQASGAGRAIEHGRGLFIHPGYFSAAHRTHAPRLTDAENLALYGICDNPAGHGHNYRVTVWHPALDALPAALWAEFDHRNLSVDLPDLRGRNVVTEAIAELIARRIPGADRVRVWETDTFYAEFKPATGAYVLGRRYVFSAAHQLSTVGGSPSDAISTYGPCARAGHHGHDFTLEVQVRAAALDPLTETAFDLGLVDRAAAGVLADLHEVDLDTAVPWLAGQMSTPAVLSERVGARLAGELGGALSGVGVSATPDYVAWKE